MTRTICMAAAATALLAGCGGSAPSKPHAAPDQTAAATACLRNSLYNALIHATGSCLVSSAATGTQGSLNGTLKVDVACSHKIANEYACNAKQTCLQIVAGSACPTNDGGSVDFKPGDSSYDVTFDGQRIDYRPVP